MGLADLYEGKKPLVLPRLGNPLALEDPGVELKPYPSCRFTHRAIDAVLDLRAQHAGRELAAIECATDPLALKILIYGEPRTGLEAKFSLQYCVAVAWLDGWPGLGAFSDARAEKADVQALLRRVTVRETRGPEEEVELVFRDGGRAREAVRLAKGNPAKPLSDAERVAKLRGCLEPSLGAARAEEVIDETAHLEDVRDVAALARSLS
jgi:2-methylcitrate dehydratase PrpD